MHKEVWEFSKEQVEELREKNRDENGKKPTTEQVLEGWAYFNYDIRHRNGLECIVDAKRRKVTIIEYEC